jgi:putative hydrolase of the HAD superfamily
MRQLRGLAPGYRLKAWSDALANFGIHDHKLAEGLAETFRYERARLYKPFPDVEPVLGELQGSYHLALVTNGPPCLQREKLRACGLEPFFREVVISGELGIGKPDPRIFEHALSRLNVSPAEAVMVGDGLERDVLGAKQAGLIAVWVRRSDPHHPLQDAGLSPDAMISGLSEFPEIIGRLDTHY